MHRLRETFALVLLLVATVPPMHGAEPPAGAKPIGGKPTYYYQDGDRYLDLRRVSGGGVNAMRAGSRIRNAEDKLEREELSIVSPRALRLKVKLCVF